MDVAGENKQVSFGKNCIQSEDERDKITLQPVLHMIQTTATDVWDELGKAFNSWLNVPDSIFNEISNSYRLIYYSNLLFDNIRHNAHLLGDAQSTCISLYGLPRTLNALFQLDLLAAGDLIRRNPSVGPTLYLERLQTTCVARCTEQLWYETLTCPTETEYYQMIITQISGHFGTHLKFLQHHSTNQNNFTRLTAILGLYVHILEDYRHYMSVNESEGDIYHPDVTLTRFSLPIIHAVNSGTEEGAKVMDIIRQRSTNKELKQYIVNLLETMGSLEYTRKTLMKLKDEALLEIMKLEKNPLFESFYEKYINIQLPSNPIQTETPADSMKYTCETIRISSYLNQMENIQCDEKMKEMLLKPLIHLESATKRNIVAKVFIIINRTIKTPEDEFLLIKKMLWRTSYGILILDDIQDKSVLRKAIPCSYLIYGVVNTVNSILYIFCDGFRQLMNLNPSKTLPLYFKHLLEAFRGQGMELYWRDSFICPTEEEYMKMVAGKTGAPLALLFGIMQACSTSTINLERLPTLMSLYFQAHDDYANLNNQEYFENKGFCEDISEGKFGFPTIHAIKTHPVEGKMIMDILRQRTYDVEVKKSCLSLLEKCGSFEYTRKKLMIFQKNMLDEMQVFEDREEIVELLTKRLSLTSNFSL